MTTNCPKCGDDISDTYQGAEFDVGIMCGGWYCDRCDLAVSDEDGPEYFDDDVMIFTHPIQPFDPSVCQDCRTPLQMGYGLAGGGTPGPYMFCPAPHCGRTIIKSQDPENV